jgi:isoquinoline 1-oxidoreductase subunit beta
VPFCFSVPPFHRSTVPPLNRSTVPKPINRRTFIAVAALAGGGVALALSPFGRRVIRKLSPHDPAQYVRILPDDSIVVVIPKSELGQGVRTSLAMLVAEELDADWENVRVETAPYDPRLLDQTTVSSGSIMSRWLHLREIGATARAMLITAAAKQWNVPRDDITTERSVLKHTSSGRTLTYGALADTLTRITPPRRVPLKPRSAWRIIGTERKGKDVADIVRGSARYGIDLRIPDMRYAIVERAREFGASVKSFDASAALRIPGVLNVVETKADRAAGVQAGVAVVASNTWAAMEGRRVLKVEWTSGRAAAENTDAHRTVMLAAVSKPGAETVARIGDPDAMLADGRNVTVAQYELPFLAHATMEPMNCTAHWRSGTVELWSPTQSPEWAVTSIASALGIPTSAVTLHVAQLIGGGFGRRLYPDFSVEAALLSRQIDAPVQVVWTREDDMRHGYYRPCALHRFEATLDDNGMPTALRHRMSSAAIGGSGGKSPQPNKFGTGESLGVSDMPYRIPNRSSEFTALESMLPRGSWRAVHTTHTIFAVESFIDELALAAKQDPLAYRLALIDANTPHPADGKEFPFDAERLKAVLRLAAEKAGWGGPMPAGHARGIACARDHLSYSAEVVEVSVENDEVKVHRIVIAADCGPIVNPLGARAQLEGGVTQALSAALHERITVSAGGVDQGNFDTYPVLRISEAPPVIETHFVDSKEERPTGLGEPSIPPLAPALANAIARASGMRLRSLPFRWSGGTTVPPFHRSTASPSPP